MKRSQTNDYTPYGGMHKQDHILRLARGAVSCNLSLLQFIQLLEIYVDAEDDTALDRAPLLEYWNLGGAPDAKYFALRNNYNHYKDLLERMHLTQRAADGDNWWSCDCGIANHPDWKLCQFCGYPRR